MAGRPDPRRRAPQGPRINHQIRIRQVRVIDEENKQLGIMETADALALAVHKQLDLVEIAARGVDERPGRESARDVPGASGHVDNLAVSSPIVNQYITGLNT